LLVCNWPHFVGQNHFFVKMLFNRDSAIQKCFQKTLHSLQVRKFSSLPAVRTTWIPVRTFLCVEKLRNAPACIRPDDSVARSDDSQCSIKPQDFFPKHRYGKIAATVRTAWILVWSRSSITQVSQFKSRRPDPIHHGPDARASDMEIACIRSAVWMTILLVMTREASIWKLFAVNV
jgi:hypothetical protein